MTRWNLPMDGGCRCGQVRVRVSAQPLLEIACHCTGCQRMSSSAFSLTLVLPAAGLQVLEGEPVVGGMHGSGVNHMFCPHCMTWMYTRPDGTPFVNLRATMLDDHTWVQPYAETYTKEKLPWATTGAVASYAEFPPQDKFMEIMRNYAAWSEAR